MTTSTVRKPVIVRILERLGFEPQSVSAKRAKEAYASGYEDGAQDEPPIGFGGGVIGRGYRTARFTVRDETSTSQEAAIERSYRQYASNPIAWAIANIGTDYVWGEDGPTLKCAVPEVKAVIDGHWGDDVNDWPGKGAQRVRDFKLYGEWIQEAFVREGDGRVRLGAIDPAEIDAVITDADNREDIIAIQLKSIGGDDQAQRGRILKVVKHDAGKLTGVNTLELATGRSFEAGEAIGFGDGTYRVIEANEPTDAFTLGWTNVRAVEVCTGKKWRARVQDGRIIEEIMEPVAGEQYDGQCFLTQVNKTTIGLRGRPDGLALIDWLDRYDQMFFDILEHAAMLKDIVWDLLVQGADEAMINTQVKAFIDAQNRSGRVFGHNEKVTVTPANPDLKGADWGSLADTVLTLIASGSRYPVYMLGSGGDANLATATAQGGPTYKGFKTRQGVVKRHITRVLQYAIDCAVAAGRLPERVPVLDSKGDPTFTANGEPIMQLARDAFEVVMPEIATKDTTAAASTFAAIVNAVLGATASQLLPKREAVDLIARGADLLGVTLDVDKVLAELDKAEATTPAPGLDGALKDAQAADTQQSMDDLLKSLTEPDVKQQ
jgi:hypothetical protein